MRASLDAIGLRNTAESMSGVWHIVYSVKALSS